MQVAYDPPYVQAQALRDNLAFALGKGGPQTREGEELLAYIKLIPSTRQRLLDSYGEITADMDAALAAGAGGEAQFRHLRDENLSSSAIRAYRITEECARELFTPPLACPQLCPRPHLALE